MSLAKLQHDFIQAINANNYPPDMLNAIKAKSQLLNKEQLKIYLGSGQGGVLNALKSIYPVTAKLLGEDFFSRLSPLYLKANPVMEPNLANYGNNFAQFLADFAPLKNYPYMSDVAKLEYNYHLAFICENEDELVLERLKNLTTSELEELEFVTAKSLFCYPSAFPVFSIWQSNLPGNTPVTISIDNNPENIVISRIGLQVSVEKVDNLTLNALNEFQAGKKFAKIISGLSEINPNYNYTELLARSINHGWLVQIK